MNATTHVAGLDVCIGGRTIQRCAVCGEKLCDSLNCAMPLNPDGSVPNYGTWEVGCLVEVTAGNPERSLKVEHVDGEQLPDNCCLVLVEA